MPISYSSACRISFTFSYNLALLELNLLTFCVSEKLLISFSFKSTFSWYRIPVRKVFGCCSFFHLSRFFLPVYFLMRHVIIIIFVPLLVNPILLLPPRYFPVFNSLNILCPDIFVEGKVSSGSIYPA